mgnify:CR=1 FL=1
MAIDPPILHGGGANPSDIDYAAYKAVFMCRVVTDNPLAGSADDHVAFLAKCRASLLRSGTNWNSSNLPYYDLKYIRNVGMNKSVDGDLNISQLDFDITFEIRNDAWPSWGRHAENSETGHWPLTINQRIELNHGYYERRDASVRH